MENEAVQTGKTVDVTLTVTAKDLWAFSMYHTNAGLMGIFNLLFTLAALYLLIFRWSSTTTPYRCLLVICVLVFTVWQPFLLWTKAKKQAKRPAVKDPMRLVFDDEKLTVSQTDNQAEFTWEQMGLWMRSYPCIFYIWTVSMRICFRKQRWQIRKRHSANW